MAQYCVYTLRFPVVVANDRCHRRRIAHLSHQYKMLNLGSKLFKSRIKTYEPREELLATLKKHIYLKFNESLTNVDSSYFSDSVYKAVINSQFNESHNM